MEETEKKVHRAYRLPPCPAYDVEGTESWLSDLARQGLMLEEDGYFAGFMSFEKTAPRNAQYRMEAIQKIGLMSDGTEHPSEEALELSEKFGWEYVLRYGEFHIYRSFDSGAREMNTDPEVQALALNAVRRRLRSSAILSLFYLLAFLLFGFNQQPVLAMVNTGTPYVLMIFALIICEEIDQIITFFRMQKLYKKLKQDGTIDHKKDWKKNARRNHAKRILNLVLILLIIVLTCRNCTASVMEEGEIPLAEYNGDPPFVTIADLKPDAKYSMTDLSYTNTVRQWSDIIAPVNYDWSECGTLQGDGFKIDGPISIQYHETIHPLIAHQIALEYHNEAKSNKRYQLWELQELDVDYAAAFMGNSPTVILQKGCVVIRATLYLNYEGGGNAYQEWATAMAQMLP